MTQKHILVVLLHGIGDCLMALPAIHALKRKHPKAKLAVMTINKPLYHDLLKYNSDVNTLLYSSLKKNPHYGNPLKFMQERKVIKQDIQEAVKKHHFTDVHFVKMFLTPAKLYATIPLKRYREHKTLKIAKELGVVLPTKKYNLKYSVKDKAWATAYLRRNGLKPTKLVGLHFTGSTKNKSLPSEQVKRLVHQLKLKGYHLLLFHDKHSYAREPSHYELEGVTTYVSDNILHTAALVDYCSEIICVDSGIAHIAAALNKKLFILYFKKIWEENSLAIGSFVTPHVYKRKGKGLLKKVRLFLQ